MRVLGVDFGRRRIGLALSDPSGMLATPWRAVEAGASPVLSARVVADLVVDRGALGADETIGLVVVGLPRRLNGEDSELTPHVRAFASALGLAAGLEVALQDERLSSHEADSRLAASERDWKKRKMRLDAAAAAVLLQDYLDRRAGSGAAPAMDAPR